MTDFVDTESDTPVRSSAPNPVTAAEAPLAHTSDTTTATTPTKTIGA